VLYNEDTVTALYNVASPAVVEIDITGTGDSIFGRSVMSGLGSGFIFDNQGHILTNNHVVEGATTVKVVLTNGEKVEAKVLGTDPVDDLAVVSIDPAVTAGITPLQLGDSGAVKVGQMAIAIGAPYGLDDTVTVGVISGKNRTMDSGSSSLTGMLQTDAALNPGNSGGPLLDVNGRVIGINTAIETTNGARGIGFAVASNTASQVIPSLIAGATISRPWLGISGLTLTDSLAEELGLSVKEGAYVVDVVSGSPAEKAGLKASGTDANGVPNGGGDVIIAVDDKAVTSVAELSAYFSTKKTGDTISLTVVRDGQTITVQTVLEARPADVQAMPVPTQVPNIPTIPWPWSGH